MNDLSDKEFLQWIHDRLKVVHKENANLNYMKRLRTIISNQPPRDTTQTNWREHDE